MASENVSAHAERFVLAHKDLNWTLDLTDWLPTLPCWPSRFTASRDPLEMKLIPQYGYDYKIHKQVLIDVVDHLLECAPVESSEDLVMELRRFRARLEAGRLYSEELQLIEQQLLQPFGHQQLPRVLSVPDWMEIEEEREQGSWGLSWLWWVVMFCLMWLAQHYQILPVLGSQP